jgi:hypothetical protein
MGGGGKSAARAPKKQPPIVLDDAPAADLALLRMTPAKPHAQQSGP